MPTARSRIPSIHELLETPAIKTLVKSIHPSSIMSTVRIVLDECSGEAHHAASEWSMPSVTELADRIITRLNDNPNPAPKRSINATGNLFYSDHGEAPLASAAAEAMRAWANEYYLCLENDNRVDLIEHYLREVEATLCELTGAEAAAVFASPTAAMRAGLFAVGQAGSDRTVLLARSQMLWKTTHYHLPTLLAENDKQFVGVGSVNRLTLQDYAQAIKQGGPAAILSVDPTGAPFSADRTELLDYLPKVALEELAKLAHENSLPLLADLNTASLIDLSEYGPIKIPTVAGVLAAGPDLVQFDAKLLGTPGCAILIGQKSLIRLAKRSPASDPVALGLPTLSALAAVLPLFKTPGEVIRSVPILSILVTPEENLKDRANRLAPQIEAIHAIESVEVVRIDKTGPFSLPTWQLHIRPSGLSIDQLVEQLRQVEPAVWGRVENEYLVIDLRTIFPRHDIDFVKAFETIRHKTSEQTEPREEK
jgi:L-seryl-tRNA(Ser) seleniumtransferase